MFDRKYMEEIVKCRANGRQINMNTANATNICVNQMREYFDHSTNTVK